MTKKRHRFLPLEGLLRRRGYRVAGLDEAGRGPWAGPLVCAAAVLKPRIKLPGLTDAKLLTPRKREELFEKILKKCDTGIGIVQAEEIDTLGLIKACEKAFLRATRRLKRKPNFLIVDGNDHFVFPIPFQSIIRGDRRIRSVAAASVLAKVIRDKLMMRLASRYPHYAFERHKGYGTRLHRRLLLRFGPCKIHRRSFRPVKEALL